MAEPGAATGVEERAAFRPAGDGPVRVLVVDDESGVRNAVSRVLLHAGMLPTTADNGASALELLEREPFDVVLLDVRMPGMTGPQLLSRIKSARYATEVIMMTAFADIATAVNAVKEGAYGFLTKPFVANESILIEVLNAAGHKRLRERTERLQRELADLWPEHPSSPASLEDVVAALSLHELAYPEAKRRVLAGFTEAYVAALLRVTGGNMSEAARRSGLDRSNFRRLLRSRPASGDPPADGDD